MIRKFGLPAMLVLAALGVAAPTASADEKLTASCGTEREYATSGWDYAGQGFTPQLSGPLSRTEIDIHKVAPTADYVVEVRTLDGLGIPTDTVLATATVARASVPVGDSLLSASFPNPATVAAGQEYALVVYFGGDDAGGVGYRTDDPCSGGIALRNGSDPWEAFLGYDMVLRAYVTTPSPVTTPSSSAAPAAKKKCKKKKHKRSAESAKKCKKKKRK